MVVSAGHLIHGTLRLSEALCAFLSKFDSGVLITRLCIGTSYDSEKRKSTQDGQKFLEAL